MLLSTYFTGKSRPGRSKEVHPATITDISTGGWLFRVSKHLYRDPRLRIKPYQTPLPAIDRLYSQEARRNDIPEVYNMKLRRILYEISMLQYGTCACDPLAWVE